MAAEQPTKKARGRPFGPRIDRDWAATRKRTKPQMDILETAVKTLSEKLGVDAELALSGLQALSGGADGKPDIAALVGALNQGGLENIVSSWLGDGANLGIDASALQTAFGDERIQQAAGAMGVEPQAMLGGLSDILPALIDQSSQGGNLLEAVGGASGLASFAKKLF